MNRTAILLSIVAAAAWFSSNAHAGDGYYRWNPAARNHATHHADLNHRAEHRAIEHHNAHHYPMNRYEHRQLHAELNHDAVHDAVEHRAAHRWNAYSPWYNQRGVTVRSPAGPFWFAR